MQQALNIRYAIPVHVLNGILPRVSMAETQQAFLLPHNNCMEYTLGRTPRRTFHDVSCIDSHYYGGTL